MKILKRFYRNIMNTTVDRNNYFEEENKRLIILPLQIIASLVVLAGAFALMFEVTYFEQFSIKIYFGRLIATFIGFVILVISNFDLGRKNPTLLIHVLLLTIIASFASIIINIPQSIYINSHLLALVIFTAALFLNWDLKNQIVVAIYYNLLFASSILVTDKSIYFLPSMYASVIYVILISFLSIVASSINYKLRQKAIEKTFEARDFFEHSTEALFRCNISTSNIVTINQSFKLLYGINDNNNSFDLPFRNLFTNKKEYDELIDILKSNNQVKGFIAKFRNLTNQHFFGSLNARLLSDKKDKTLFMEGNIRDITKEKLADEKIQKYNEELKILNTSKDKFFSIVAHDLISPFSAVIGYSEILAEEYKDLDQEQVGQFAKDINSVSQKAHNLLNELLDWSRIQTGRMQYDPQSLNLKTIVEDLLILYTENAKKKRIELNNTIDKTHRVFADYKMINTTIRNLISNAIKFTYEGGLIVLSSEIEGNFLSVCVEDNGVGISKEDLEKLFKIDVHHTQIGTGKEKGSGLGLILCSEFVKKNGGAISVESENGKGAKFRFTVPIPSE